MKKKIFIYGVGAQKAGTTWLYNYIQNDPNANLGILKEYHFWNYVFVQDKNPKNNKLESFINRPQKDLNQGELIRSLMLRIKGYYGLYFNSIINSGFNITGDFTPQYQRGAKEHHKYVKDYLESLEFTVKVIFLIRDPVERLWSNIRMEKKLYKTIPDSISDSEAIKKSYKFKKWHADSLYDFTINALRLVFEEKNIYVGIYEEMFNEDKIKEISDFIGIECNLSMMNKKINSTLKKEELDINVVKEVKEFHNETYEFCYENFPQTKHLWNK